MRYGIVAVLLWASAFAVIRYGLLHGLSPLTIAAYRLFLASIFFAIYLIILRKRIPPLKDLWQIAVLAFFGFFCYNALLNLAEQTLDAGTASFIIAQTPIFCSIIAVIFLNEKMKRIAILGYLLSITGIAMMLFKNGLTHIRTADIFILLAAFSQSIYFVAQKPLLLKYSPIEITAYCQIIACLWFVLLTPQAFTQSFFSTSTPYWVIVYLALGPSLIAYSLWAKAISQNNVTTVTSLLFILPFCSSLVALVLLQEGLSRVSLLGGIISIVGVFVARISLAQKHSKPSSLRFQGFFSAINDLKKRK